MLKVKGKDISFVAIDGLRLAITKKQLSVPSGDINVVIPARALNEISKLMNDNDEIVTISLNNKKIMADMGHTKVIAQLLEGEFVNYERIIPRDSVTEIKVNREQFEQTLVIFKYSESIAFKQSAKNFEFIASLISFPCKLTGTFSLILPISTCNKFKVFGRLLKGY